MTIVTDILGFIKNDDCEGLEKFIDALSEYEHKVVFEARKMLILECLQAGAHNCAIYFRAGREYLSHKMLIYCIQKCPKNASLQKYISSGLINYGYRLVEEIVKVADPPETALGFEAINHIFEPKKVYYNALLHAPANNGPLVEYIKNKYLEHNTCLKGPTDQMRNLLLYSPKNSPLSDSHKK